MFDADFASRPRRVPLAGVASSPADAHGKGLSRDVSDAASVRLRGHAMSSCPADRAR